MQDPDITEARAGPTLFHIADRFFNRPLLLHPTKAEVVLAVLQGRLPLHGAVLGSLPTDANRFIGTRERASGKPGLTLLESGVATIPIIGSLVNRGGWIGASSGLTSYEGLSAQLRDAQNDPEVESILLDIDSPGGEATGMFSVAELIRHVGRTKPVTAFVNDMAASAAYGIASAANEIVVSPTSLVGSIGVVLTHLDKSAQLEQQGVKPTLIYAGKHKVDGNPFGPLSEAVQADLQDEVMKFYDQFVGLVGRGRLGMSEPAIRATEARTYIGQDAINRGLADRIASLDDVLSSLKSRARGASHERTSFAMSKDIKAAPQAGNAGVLDANDGGSGAPDKAALDAARAEGAKAERERIRSIVGCEAAEGRQDQALAMALETDIDAEGAIKVLSVSPKKAAGSSIPTIAERAAGMAEFGASGNEKVSAEATTDALWAKTLAKFK